MSEQRPNPPSSTNFKSNGSHGNLARNSQSSNSNSSINSGGTSNGVSNNASVNSANANNNNNMTNINALNVNGGFGPAQARGNINNNSAMRTPTYNPNLGPPSNRSLGNSPPNPSPNELLMFLNSNSTMAYPSAPSPNLNSTANNNNNNSNANLNNSNVPGSSGISSNSAAMSRLETIRQYYMQLSNNLRLITQQLQSPDLTAQRRQTLLLEQARANAAMQEFTEKILKPISASKQQQQQAQAQAQLQATQMQQQQRPSQQQQTQPQMMQFMNRAPGGNAQLPNNTKTNMLPSGATNFMPQQRPTGLPQTSPNVNLYSHSGMGMIRPIINAPLSSTSGNLPATNASMMNRQTVPLSSSFRPPLSQQQQQQQQQQHAMTNSPQRTNFRPVNMISQPSGSTGVNPINSMNINNSSTCVVNASVNAFPPGTPNSKGGQMIMNRQTFLMAAQQHQNSVLQQQLLFQQRMVLFSRDPSTLTPNSKSVKKSKGAPVLALPSNNGLKHHNFISPQKGKPLSNSSALFSTNSGVVVGAGGGAFSHILQSSKTSSFPISYSAVPVKLADLAKSYNLTLDGEAENFLLKVADEFVESLARKSVTFASHRIFSKKQLQQQKAFISNGGNSKNGVRKSSTVPSEEPAEFSLSAEDLMLGLDELINYQPAGNGSIEACRPLTKRHKESSESGGSSNNTTNSSSGSSNSSSTNNNTSNHQHRLNLVKKHASLYQYYM